MLRTSDHHFATTPTTGQSVLVRWTDGKEYPARVLTVRGTEILCGFANGNQMWAGAALVRAVSPEGGAKLEKQDIDLGWVGSVARVMTALTVFIGGGWWGLMIQQGLKHGVSRGYQTAVFLSAGLTFFAMILPAIALALIVRRRGGSAVVMGIVNGLLAGMMAFAVVLAVTR